MKDILKKIYINIRKNGLKQTLIKIYKKLTNYNLNKYRVWKRQYEISVKTKKAQSNKIFEKNPLISIIIPTYNTKIEYIDDLILSIKEQTYQNWEVCIGDGSEDEKKKRYIKSLKSNKIKVKTINKNLGIAGNTIEGYKLCSGDYIVFADHDDILMCDALYEIVKCINENDNVDFIFSDNAVIDEGKRKIVGFQFFQGYSLELLRSYNYASHITAFSKRIIDEVGFLKKGYDGAQDYDLELRVIEKARKIIHLPRVLYLCRSCEGSVAQDASNKMYAYESGKKALQEHLNRIGNLSTVEFIKKYFSYRIHYELTTKYSVAIVIPNKDYYEGLKRCINSIIEKTTYSNFQIYIVENNSEEVETFKLYKELQKYKNIEVKTYPHKEFNYSKMNNWVVNQISEDYVVLLNNDTEVITPQWIEEMLSYAQRDSTGAVGCMLYYENNTIQHCGLCVGLNGSIASHFEHKNLRGENGYLNTLKHVQNCDAVTAACLMIKRENYLQVNGLDEEVFPIALNDIDLCLKLIEIGKTNVFTPYVELYHYESMTRGSDESGQNAIRYQKDISNFKMKWVKYFEDEYRKNIYHNLSKYVYK